MEDYQRLNEAYELVIAGKKIDVFKLPMAITPEKVIGCSEKERIESFNKLLGELTAEKSLLGETSRKFGEKLQKSVFPACEL